MKQHPIPQNILDIEFKLFSHFTIREFAYIAIGGGFGLIFLYLMSTQKIPGWVAIPIFLISAGTGAFLGLVPINDQKADVYFRNFIKSVTSPTLRVWKSDFLDHSIFKDHSAVEALADAKNQQAVKDSPQIIGAARKKSQLKNESEVMLETEESEKKIELNRIAQETGNSVPVSTPAATPQPTDTQQPTPPTQPTPPQPVMQQSVAIQQNPPSSNNVPPVKDIKVPPEIVINNANIDKFKAQFSLLDPPPNSINISVRDDSNYPIPKTVVLIKDNTDKIMQVKVTDAKGEVVTERAYDHGIYKLEFQQSDHIFPKVVYAFNNATDEPIKIIGVRK